MPTLSSVRRATRIIFAPPSPIVARHEPSQNPKESFEEDPNASYTLDRDWEFFNPLSSIPTHDFESDEFLPEHVKDYNISDIATRNISALHRWIDETAHEQPYHAIDSVYVPKVTQGVHYSTQRLSVNTKSASLRKIHCLASVCRADLEHTLRRTMDTQSMAVLDRQTAHWINYIGAWIEDSDLMVRVVPDFFDQRYAIQDLGK